MGTSKNMQALLERNRKNAEKAKEAPSTQATNMIEATINAHEESKKVPEEPQKTNEERKTSTKKKKVDVKSIDREDDNEVIRIKKRDTTKDWGTKKTYSFALHDCFDKLLKEMADMYGYNSSSDVLTDILCTVFSTHQLPKYEGLPKVKEIEELDTSEEPFLSKFFGITHVVRDTTHRTTQYIPIGIEKKLREIEAKYVYFSTSNIISIILTEMCK